MSQSYPALHRNRDFVLLMAGQAGSRVGTSMTTLALVMLGYAVTRSSALAGVVSAVYGISMAVTMLPAGAIVDRTNRKTIMVLTSTIGAAVLASIPVAGLAAKVTYPHLIIVAALAGVLSCFYDPAETAAVKEVIPAQQMGTAMATNQARSAVAGLIGPPASGVLYGIGRTIPFAVDALTYAVAAGCTALVRHPLPAPTRKRPEQHLLRDVAEGVGWVRRAKTVRDLVLSTMVSNCAFTGASTAVLLSLQQSGTPSTQLGLLQAGYGIAAVTGSLIASRVLSRFRIGTAVRLALWAFAVATLLAVLHSSIWWMGACIALANLLVPSYNTAMSAYEIHVTPQAMLGRSSAATSFGRIVMIPLGSAVAGILVQATGRIPSLTIFAALMAVAAAMATLSKPIAATPKTTELHAIAEIE